MFLYPFQVTTEEEKADKQVFSALVDADPDPKKSWKYLFPELCETQPELDFFVEGPQSYCTRQGWDFWTLEELKELYCDG